MSASPSTPLLVAADQVAKRCAAQADRHDREASFPRQNFAAAWEAGLGLLTVPVEWGGAGADLATTVAVLERIGRADASTALVLCMHWNHLHQICDPSGPWSERAREMVLTSCRQGPALLNSAVVEPELGSPSRGGVPATQARLAAEGRGWRLTGRKTYVTGSEGLAFVVVRAATADADSEGVRVGSFLVQSPQAGLKVVKTWDHLGLRASSSHDLEFDQVWADAECAVGLQGGPSGPEGTGRFRSTLMQMSVYAGVAKAARDFLVAYLNERVPTNLGAPLASLPRFQEEVGAIETMIFANDRVLHSVAAQKAEDSSQAAAAKHILTTNVISVCERSVALIGNPGLSYHHPLQRYLRDALCSRIHAPQDDVILGDLGRRALTHPQPGA